MGRAEVGPLAQIRLAEDTSARVPQLLRDEGVLRGPRADERERAGGRLHAVGGGDVVFDEDGDAVQRPAHAPRSEEHTSELQSRQYLVCRLLLEKKKRNIVYSNTVVDLQLT